MPISVHKFDIVRESSELTRNVHLSSSKTTWCTKIISENHNTQGVESFKVIKRKYNTLSYFLRFLFEVKPKFELSLIHSNAYSHTFFIALICNLHLCLELNGNGFRALEKSLKCDVENHRFSFSQSWFSGC